MIGEVAAEVLAEVIVAAGRRLGVALTGLGSRADEDLAVARWFDTYRLTGRVVGVADLPEQLSEVIESELGSDEIQAVVHELLAARLTDAPESDVARIRELFDLTLAGGIGGPLQQPLPAGANSGQAAVAAAAAGLFDYFDGEICDLVGGLEGHDPELLRQVRSEALAARMIAILHAVERHAAALSGRADHRTAADFLARYRQHVVEYHGKIEPPDFERRQRVPAEDIYVPPVITEIAAADDGQPPRELDLGVLGAEMDRTVLLGDPGGGKTTAAGALMYRRARESGSRTPFLVTLRDYAGGPEPGCSVTGFIEHRLEIFYQCPAPPGLVMQLLLLGKAVVIFDGLDELLDAGRRSEAAAVVERFCAEYPLAPVLVTSRVIGYDQARLDDRQFTCYRIAGFSDSQVAEYAGKWFSRDPDASPARTERWTAAFLAESASVADLRTNPALLSLMCILYRGEGSLPRNRSEIFGQCAGLLFRKWDARRQIQVSLQAGHLIEPALRRLAWWLFTRQDGQSAVTERQLAAETTSFLHGRGFESEAEAGDAAGEIIRFCRGRMWVFTDIGTTAAGDPLYGFTHRTFLEYFAAAHLAYANDSPEKLARVLAPRAARHEWEVVGELALQIKDRAADNGAERAYTALLAERRHRSVSSRSGILQFLARSLRSVDPPPRVIRELSRAILAHLMAGELDDQDRYLPLAWLQSSCVNCSRIVSEEINACAADAIASPDHDAHIKGLRLAGMQASGVITMRSGSKPVLPPGHPLISFWEQRQNENVQIYKDQILAAAVNDGGFRQLALFSDLLSTRQAIQMPGGLTTLLSAQTYVIFEFIWAAHLPTILSSLVLGWGQVDPADPAPLSYLTEPLEDIGNHLTQNPEPPWLHSRPDARWPDYFWGHPNESDTSRLQLTPLAYLGAAATLLAIAETCQPPLPPPAEPSRLGPLSDLHPYLAQRQRQQSETGHLPPLPLPAEFQQTFADWAAAKINFISQGAAETPAGS